MTHFDPSPTHADIMIVDDTLPNLQILADMLSGQGYEVRGVPDGPTALRAIRAERPDLILLDIQMPGMDGYEVCQQLKADESVSTVPVIFISAMDDIIDKVKAFEVGGVDYITKPFQIEEVLARVKTHLSLSNLQNQLQLSLAREKELNEMRARFLSMASHDLRTPLAVIQAANDTLSKYHDRLTEEKRQIKYDRIKTSLNRMLELLDDVLTIARSEAGTRGVEPEAVNLAVLCEDILGDLQSSIGRDHYFDFSVSGQCEGLLMDPKLLHHTITNLLSNAIKYSAAGSTVTFHVFCRDHETEFYVQDEGIGIPEVAQGHLFEAFHRAENVGQTPGTGLGLAIVKQSVEMQGGAIHFESEEGVGSAFTVLIPHTELRSNQEAQGVYYSGAYDTGD